MALSTNTAVVALLAFSFICSALADCTPGGASTFKSVGGDVVSAWNAANPSSTVGAYDPVGSGDGIKGFKAGTYLIAVSDEPMSVAQETGITKITAPLLVATYSFFVHASSLTLTAKQSYEIYAGTIASWASIAGTAGKLTGAPVRVARSDKSGTTAVIQTMWKLARTGYAGATDGTVMAFAGLVTVDGTTAMCNKVKDTVGAIGYAHTGSCLPVVKANPGAIGEVALKNAAGKAVTSKNWKVAAAIVGKVRAPSKSWAGLSFVWKGGASTPPMVSMQYSFIKTSLAGVTGGKTCKAFMMYTLNNVAKKGSTYGFYGVPTKWFTPSKTAVSKISANM